MNTRYDGWPPSGLGGDGAMLVGKHPKKSLPPIAQRFKDELKDLGWTPSDLAREALKRFGDRAAVPQSFRRLVTPNAPESDSKTVGQAEVVIKEARAAKSETDPVAKLSIEHMAEDSAVAGAIAPLIGHIPAARDADEETVVAASRRLMQSRHASLHALLTLLLASK